MDLSDLDLKDVILLLIKRMWLLLLCILSGSVIALLVSYILIKPVYISNFSLCVYNTEQTDSKMSSSDIYASQMLLSTCAVILDSNTVLNLVLQELNDGTTIEYLKKSMNVKEIEDTNILQILVNTSDVERTYRISRALVEVVPDAVSRIMRTGTIQVLDKPEQPKSTFSLNKIYNTLLGGLIGLGVGIILAFALRLMDTTVKAADDLRQKYDVPVLGEIPDFELGFKGAGKSHG